MSKSTVYAATISFFLPVCVMTPLQLCLRPLCTTGCKLRIDQLA